MQLDNYNVPEILNAASSSGKLDIVLKILEKNELWNYAFKVALYGLQRIEDAEIFADRSGHPEAWHALAEFYLFSGDAVSSVKFAKKSGNFRRQKELVILLHLSEHYSELLDFLLFLKSSPGYDAIYEREVLLCLIKLGKIEELSKFIESANPSLANEIGKVLCNEGNFDLAAKYFQRAGNFEKASLCLLKLGNVDVAAELASKTTKFE